MGSSLEYWVVRWNIAGFVGLSFSGRSPETGQMESCESRILDTSNVMKDSF